jgi:hypothetical protein
MAFSKPKKASGTLEPTKKEESREIDAATMEYLAKGGTIKRIERDKLIILKLVDGELVRVEPEPDQKPT